MINGHGALPSTLRRGPACWSAGISTATARPAMAARAALANHMTRQSAEGSDQHGRDRDAAADSGEMHGRQAAATGMRQPFEDEGGGEDQGESRGEARDQAQQEKQRERVRESHRRQARGIHREPAEQPARRDPGSGGRRHQRSREVAREVGRSDQAPPRSWRDATPRPSGAGWGCRRSGRRLSRRPLRAARRWPASAGPGREGICSLWARDLGPHIGGLALLAQMS